MSDDNNLVFVQFPHPGTEYVMGKGKLGRCIEKGWNYDIGHHRKFLRTSGSYMNGNKETETENLFFWGEWEPDSKAECCQLRPTRWVHTPILNIDHNGQILAKPQIIEKGVTKQRRNTDPFVFGDDGFLYSCCRQKKSLKKIGPGSIILFGSRMQGHFAIDTVFVVGDFRDYTAELHHTKLKGFTPKYYTDIMGMDFGEVKGAFRCYKGATPKNRINGMYSFSPCHLTGENNVFERPIICSNDFKGLTLSRPLEDGLISDTVSRNFKMTSQLTLDDLHKIWERICELILKDGIVAGTKFNYELCYPELAI